MDDEKSRGIKRREFVRGLIGLGVLSTGPSGFGATIRYFAPMDPENPLAAYPNRDWEKVYRNIFAADSSFVFLCAPNDTHNCLLKAYVKNDVVTRIGPTFGYGKATDLYGNKASARWDPRICQKGVGMARKVYGDRRVKSPMIRRGFKAWADAGFPRDDATGRPDPKYFQRGRDQWLRASWDEVYEISARALENIGRTYSGEGGAKLLAAQGYDPAMIKAIKGAGTETLKFRGGMAFLGATRIYGLYRFANSLALMDAKHRGVSPDEAHGARGWDSYSWHTDLPPGHPMVTGMQTNDFELFTVENANLVIVWGMNWITTKMPDSHWLTEARLKGVKVATVTVEYSATASKCDEIAVIRPGTDPAFALGMAQVIIAEGLLDKDFVETNTDLPLLIRMDNLQPLTPAEVFEDFVAPELTSIDFIDPSKIDNTRHRQQFAPESWKDDFKGSVVYDKRQRKLVAVSRDDVGESFKKKAIVPDLEADLEVTLVSGEKVRVRSSFGLIKEYLDNSFTPAQTSTVTGVPASAVISLARQVAANPEKTLIACGMGPNQFFNSDLKDRAILLVAALTRNIGFPGGNVGSYSGNYKSAIFGGLPYFVSEDPFHLQLRKDGKVKKRKCLKYESLHYYNYGDRPLRIADKLFTGDTHLPAPTKSMWLSNSNSVIANVKWHYDVVNNTLPKIEFVAFADWWWTGSCEYADVVFAVDSWAEFKHPDMCASGSNPFVQVFPRTPLARIFNTKPDIEVIAGVAEKLAEILDEPRLAEHWKFVKDGDVATYLQRIIDGSYTLKGYDIVDLERKAKEGVPALIHTRSYPRVSSYEQVHSEEPWYTRTGRLEFYKADQAMIEAGEAIPVHREPIDSTPYEPNVIVGKEHPAIRPKTPSDYGLDDADLSCEPRQVRNVVMSPSALVKSVHPLRLKQFTHIYHTPKYRHGVHTTPIDIDYVAVWFGPFGDVYRRDKRSPFVAEGYVDINPLDAKALGIEDGDYVYIDADPEDRPFRDWQGNKESYKVARLLLRARYYPGTPRGVARTWHNMSGSTFGSVKGHETNPSGLAKNPETGYQSMYRYGSHQSATRAWLRPTLMTDTLMYKDMFGQGMAKGFTPDIHCPVGAPREAFVQIKRAEAGAMGGSGVWRPAELGFRPTYESQAMLAYLQGRFMQKKA